MPTQFAASQTIAITAATLANNTAQQSAAIATDVTQNVNDYRITVKVGVGAGTPGNSKAVFVWVKISDDGTNWDGNAGATDATIALDVPHQFKLGVVIPIGAQSITRGGSFSLRSACGGSIPANWGIIIENVTGIALSSCVAVARREYTS